jgi:hypothetical protein
LNEITNKDLKCICEGNWRLIIKESEALLDKKFIDKNGVLHVFSGIMHCTDDYYYAMFNMKNKKIDLYSCVGSLSGFGFELLIN